MTVRLDRLLVGPLFVAAASLAASLAAQNAQTDIATDRAIRSAIERTRLVGGWSQAPQYAVSPDRRLLVYAVQRADIDSNLITVELWAGALTTSTPPRRLARLAQSSAMPALVNPSFSPDGESIAITGSGTAGGLALVDVESGAIRSLAAAGPDDGPISDALWSPDGRHIAILFNRSDRRPVKGGVQVEPDWTGRGFGRSTDGLAILDAHDGHIVATTPADLDVSGITRAFSWRPDGSELVFSARDATKSEGDPDLYLLEIDTAKLRSLYQRPGDDLDPGWSPDGRWIAFQTTNGDVSAWAPRALALIDPVSKRRTIPTGADEQPLRAFAVQWLDRDRLSFVTTQKMGCPLFTLDVARLNLRQLSPDDLSCAGAARPGPNGTLIAARHGWTAPGSLIISSDRDWTPSPLDPALEGASPPGKIRPIHWPSADGRFEIWGVLIEPEAREGPAPLLVSLAGGPDMVGPSAYNEDAPFLLTPALLRGYAILLPNSRGRGGYGDDFAKAIARSGDYLPGPYADMMSGVDHLIATGLADPDRLALAGFSYGGILAAYAAGRTDRFAAIMTNEASVDFYSRGLQSFGGPNEANAQGILGFSNPFDPVDRGKMLDQSPLHHARDVRTPLLMECGLDGLAGTECLKYFRTVRRLSPATVEFIVYPRTGHVIHEPALRRESAMRQIAWLDRWLGPAAGDRVMAGANGRSMPRNRPGSGCGPAPDPDRAPDRAGRDRSGRDRAVLGPRACRPASGP